MHERVRTALHVAPHSTAPHGRARQDTAGHGRARQGTAGQNRARRSSAELALRYATELCYDTS